MLKEFIRDAKDGNPVYISTVSNAFEHLPEHEKQTFHCILNLIEGNEKKLFEIYLPAFSGLNSEEVEFVKNYVCARLYNVLSSLGGQSMDIYANNGNKPLMELLNSLEDVFCINMPRKARKGYGRCVNVIDRMLDVLCPEAGGFRFRIHNITESKANDLFAITSIDEKSLINATSHMEGKTICGIDVGGTDIKIVLIQNEKINCYKEYDWFPASFKASAQLVEPICMIVRLMRVKASLDNSSHKEKSVLVDKVERALDKEADDVLILNVIEEAEAFLKGQLVLFDAIGLCFPDVVVKNKIVGGEVYKTRGIRNNPLIDYEEDFKQLTNLDERLKVFCKHDTSVNIINDGPMAAFTAALENIAATGHKSVENGVFAHTLGTELGSGWVLADGRIPNIPLELYNFIIDLGSFTQKHFPSDDLRSINNFNTDLPGTLQKYTSQSGVFRLAMKYFPSQRPDLFEELKRKGFVVERVGGGEPGYYVPTEPKDQRKPFLEHMMSLPDRENDKVNNLIWKEIGEFLAVTSLEMDRILTIDTPVRILFGRLMKNRRCFELMREGAKNISDKYIFEPADKDMANTYLMTQLKSHPVYTVAQFAQAVGAAYFGNYKLLEE